jgi:hypothetical protein
VHFYYFFIFDFYWLLLLQLLCIYTFRFSLKILVLRADLRYFWKQIFYGESKVAHHFRLGDTWYFFVIFVGFYIWILNILGGVHIFILWLLKFKHLVIFLTNLVVMIPWVMIEFENFGEKIILVFVLIMHFLFLIIELIILMNVKKIFQN